MHRRVRRLQIDERRVLCGTIAAYRSLHRGRRSMPATLVVAATDHFPGQRSSAGGGLRVVGYGAAGNNGGFTTMRITMIGSGYVGLVSGACFSDFGHDVCCVDKDEGKIAALIGGPDADLRARARRAGGRQRRGGAADLHHRPGKSRSRARTRSSSLSVRRPGAATAMPTFPMSSPRRRRSPRR